MDSLVASPSQDATLEASNATSINLSLSSSYASTQWDSLAAALKNSSSTIDIVGFTKSHAGTLAIL